MITNNPDNPFLTELTQPNLFQALQETLVQSVHDRPGSNTHARFASAYQLDVERVERELHRGLSGKPVVEIGKYAQSEFIERIFSDYHDEFLFPTLIHSIKKGDLLYFPIIHPISQSRGNGIGTGLTIPGIEYGEQLLHKLGILSQDEGIRILEKLDRTYFPFPELGELKPFFWEDRKNARRVAINMPAHNLPIGNLQVVVGFSEHRGGPYSVGGMLPAQDALKIAA